MEGQIEGFPMDEIEVEIDNFEEEIENEHMRHNNCLFALLKFLFCLTSMINVIMVIKVYLDLIENKDPFSLIILIISFYNL